jgi:hypothetical protein
MPRTAWHTRVQRKAADMQAASLAVAGLIAYFEERGLCNCAAGIREIALREGVQKTEASFRALTRLRSP